MITKKDIKVGELYTHPFWGIVVVTVKKDDGRHIGKCQRVRSDTADSLLLYESALERMRVTTDSDIEEFLTYQVGRHEIDCEITAIINDHSLYLLDAQDQVLLTSKQALALKELLNRELV